MCPCVTAFWHNKSGIGPCNKQAKDLFPLLQGPPELERGCDQCFCPAERKKNEKEALQKNTSPTMTVVNTVMCV